MKYWHEKDCPSNNNNFEIFLTEERWKYFPINFYSEILVLNLRISLLAKLLVK